MLYMIFGREITIPTICYNDAYIGRISARFFLNMNDRVMIIKFT
jgi:hypothetical protein